MTDESTTPPALSYRRRSGNIFSKIQMVLLRPVAFFKTLEPMGETRQWLLIVVIILGLVGYSAVRQSAEIGLDGTLQAGTLSDQLIIALTASAPYILAWLSLMLLLSLVSMFDGTAPKLGKNLQVAIWSSVPFALMAAIQIVYILAGETIVDAGITPVMVEWNTEAVFGETVQILLNNAYQHITVFGFWHLALLYIGAKHTLMGKGWVIVLVIAIWVLAVILLPTGYDILQLPPPDLPVDETFVPLN